MVNYLKGSQLENINLFFIIPAIKQKFLCKLGRKKHFLKLKYHFRSCMCEETLSLLANISVAPALGYCCVLEETVVVWWE